MPRDLSSSDSLKLSSSRLPLTGDRASLSPPDPMQLIRPRTVAAAGAVPETTTSNAKVETDAKAMEVATIDARMVAKELAERRRAATIRSSRDPPP